ncbi:MAG: hypothetical protein GXO22_08145 [Aquificae bacterium]|nr:hypothetical protein [Aquificota bacterium]
MKILKFLLIFIIIFNINVYSQELDTLLEEYIEVSEPSKKTIRESLGHYIVFTREDIEKMGFYRLIDVLKSIPLGNVLPNLFGFNTYNYAGLYDYVPFYVKLYINDHEVSSLYFGSPFLVWENIPLDNINHIEIYYFSGATSLGNEPAGLIIKLYTKDPSKENVILSSRFGISSRSSYDGAVLITDRPSKDLSYLFLINQSFIERKDFSFFSKKIKRDSLNRYIFFHLNYKDTSIEYADGHVNRYSFFGLSLDKAPDEAKLKISERYLQITQKLLENKSLKVQLSVDNNNRDYYEYNQNLIFIPAFWDNNNLFNNPVFYTEKINFFKYTAFISKEIKTKKHNLILGINYKYYNYKIRNRNYITALGESIYKNYITPFSKEKVYSLIVEDILNIDKKNLAILTFRYDIYDRNGGFKDYKEYISRLGYIHTFSKEIMMKTFIQRHYFVPFFYHLDFAGKDLDTQKIPFYISAELQYKTHNQKISVLYAYAKIKDSIAMDIQTLRFVNVDKSYYPSSLNLIYQKKYKNSKFSFNYFKMFNINAYSPLEGGFLKYLKYNHKYDFYTELIYRKGFTIKNTDLYLDDSYDLNLSFRYKIDRKKSIILKGQNILGKGIKYPFINNLTNDVIYVPSFDREYFVIFEINL